jgi:hypothetical protein
VIEPLRTGDPAESGPYRLLGRLAAGGMGQVFVGRSRGGRVVAVKVIHPGLAGGDEFRVRFAREVEAARRVGGYHTAEVVDADAYVGAPWMATAYVPGPSLHEAVSRNGVLGAEAVRALGAGLVGGLEAIHAAGLVHRDLKPANVLLTVDGPRVIDFGIARAMDATSVTTSGDRLGTAAYMSPEQVRGEEAGPPSDVFALGCVLYFAATGRSPFGSGPTEAIVYRVVHGEVDLADVPEELRGPVGDCLAKEAAARPTLAHVLDELRPGPGEVARWRLPDGVGRMIAERAEELRDLQARELPAVTEIVRPDPDGAGPEGAGPGGARNAEIGWDPGVKRVPARAWRRRPLVWWAVGVGVAVVTVATVWLVRVLGAEQEPVDTVASGAYSLAGEPLGDAPVDAPHTVRVEIVTPEEGEVVTVDYRGQARTTTDGGTQEGQVGNGDGFTVRTPWTGTIPVEAELLSLAVTAQGSVENITCRISLDGELAAEGTDSYTSTCAVPVDMATALDGLF